MRTKLIAAALGIGMALTTLTAHAMRPEADSTHGAACLALWDAAQQRVDEYSDTDPASDRRRVLLNELRNIGSDWKTINCQGTYGSILVDGPPVPPKPAPTTNRTFTPAQTVGISQ